MNKSLKLSLACFLMIISLITYSRELILPFDHGKHSEAELEWWDFFGELTDSNNQTFGFNLNFIRLRVNPQQSPSLWRTRDVYTSYLTITDNEQKQFYLQEKENRTSFNFAGASDQQLFVWNRNWTAFMNDKPIFLMTETKDSSLNLRLSSTKSPILLGNNGFLEEQNLYLYSLPNLQGIGELRLGDHHYQIVRVKGAMEHAFQINKSSDIVSDKFVIQLDNNDDILIYILASQQSNFTSPESFCIISYTDEKSVLLGLSDFHFEQLNSWFSVDSQITYPSGWRLTIPSAHFDLNIVPAMKNQEIVTMNDIYWKGHSFVTGTKDGVPVKGYAYVELSKKITRDYVL